MMTKRNFEAIARAIRECAMCCQPCRVVLAHQVAGELAEHGGNPRFDRQRFIEACLRET